MFEQEDDVTYIYHMTSQGIASSFLSYLKKLPYTVCVAYNSNSAATTNTKNCKFENKPVGYDLPFVCRFAGHSNLTFQNCLYKACSGVSYIYTSRIHQIPNIFFFDLMPVIHKMSTDNRKAQQIASFSLNNVCKAYGAA